MITGDLFSLRFKNYLNQDLITFLKSFTPSGGSKWIPENKQWVISFKHYDEILTKVVRLAGRDIEDPDEGLGRYHAAS